MEKLLEIKSLHYKVQNNIFNILTEYEALKHQTSTLYSKIPVYSFPQLNIGETSSKMRSFAESIHRLLEIKFLLMVSGTDKTNFYFIKNEDYNKLNSIEKKYHSIISENIFTDLILKGKRLSFSDENL